MLAAKKERTCISEPPLLLPALSLDLHEGHYQPLSGQYHPGPELLHLAQNQGQRAVILKPSVLEPDPLHLPLILPLPQPLIKPVYPL
jgi:hypothetical protein